MNIITATANQLQPQRPTVRLRQDWERDVSSDDEEGPINPVSEDQGRRSAKQKRETRARPGGMSAGRSHQISTTKSSHEFQSELARLYSNRTAVLESLDASRTYYARSGQSLPQKLQDHETYDQNAINHLPHRSFIPFGYGFVTRVANWILTLLRTILTLLQFPTALLITILIAYWGLQQALTSLPFPDVNLCGYPVISRLELCQMSSSEPVNLPPRVKQALDYTSHLGEMQVLGAYSADLPHLLSMGERGVHAMIVQLSVGDLPTKKKPMPLLRDYRDTVDRTIDGLSDWLAKIDRVVDYTILVNTWAESQLQQIEERDSSLMTPLNNVINRVFGVTLGFATTEEEVCGEFFGLTEKVGTQVTKMVVEAQRVHGQLNELRAILDSIALAVLGDEKSLEKKKLKKASYWRWILRDYRDKMTEFDAKMQMCAHFYDHTVKGLQVVSATQMKIKQMKSQLKVLRDVLNDAPLLLDNGKPAPLRLYIDAVKGGVESLEATKKRTQALKAEKMRRVDEVIRLETS